MPQKTDAELIVQASEIKNETDVGANTATRIGQMVIDVVDSKSNNDDSIIASEVSFNPVGNISATDVQAAIQELDTEKEAVGVAAGLIATEVTNRNAAIVSALEGLKWKDSVKVATTTAGTLATSFENGDTIDGIALATGDRILIKDQVTQSENGIYIVAASGAPARSSDANSAVELEGATVPVQRGTSNANTSWTQTTDGITLGSSNLLFTQIGSSVPDSSETVKGIIEIATQAETHTGTDDVRTITPLKLAAEKDATGGYAGLTLFKINFKNVANTFISFFTNSNTAARTYTFQDRNGTIADDTDLALKAPLAGSKVIQLAASDETTALTTGTGKITFRMPYAMTVSAVRASLVTAQTSGSIFTVDINEAGTTIISTKLTIDNTEKTSTTAATAAVISDTALADDAEITIDIDQIGDGTAKGLKITLIGS